MLKKIILVWSLLLTGCDTFIPNLKTKSTIITWNIVEDANKVCKEKGVKVPNDHQIIGCATFYPNMIHCEIYTNKKTTLDILGHEIRHCFEGHWHE